MSLLDASALLALLQNEPGSDEVQAVLLQAAISTANLSEVVAKLVQKGVPDERATQAVSVFELEVVPVDETVALAAGILAREGKPLGLSLGDRICLATGRLRHLPTLTTDRQWSRLSSDYRVHVIR